MNIDWSTLLTALGSAGAQYGMDRTKQYNDIRQQEAMYDAMSGANEDYLKKLKALYSSELSGELQPSELAAREKLVGKAKSSAGADQAALNQALSRAGVTGGKVAGQGVQGIDQNLQDYIAGIDASLVAGADNRRSTAQGMIANVEGQNSISQAPLQAQIDFAKKNLGDYKLEDMQQYLAMPFMTALIGGGINKFAGKGSVDTGAAVQEAALAPLLQKFGMNTGMFDQADEQLPTEVGGTLYTPRQEKGLMGNTRTVYDKSLSADTQAKIDKAKFSTVEPAKLKQADDLLARSDIDPTELSNATYNASLDYILEMGQVPELEKIKVNGKREKRIVVTRGGKKYYYDGTGSVQDEKNWKLVK